MGVSDPGEPAQLNGTNNPFGLIFYFSVNPSFVSTSEGQQRRQKISNKNEALNVRFRFLYVDIRESVHG
jgi:hypothetical protein